MNLDYSNIGDYSRAWGEIMDCGYENIFDIVIVIVGAYLRR